MKKTKTPQEMIINLKDPFQIFDLTCASNYFAGKFNQPMPVDDSRQAFNRIKELILKDSK